MSSMKRIVGIGGGYPYETYGEVAGAEDGWIVAYPPWNEPISSEDHPLELIVENFEPAWNPEKDADYIVTVKIKRTKGGVIDEHHFKRSHLKERPFLLERSI